MICCVLVITVRQQKPELGVLLATASGVLMLGLVLAQIIPAVRDTAALISGTGAGEYVRVVLKALGICFVTQLAADICRDSGQQTIASVMETAGRGAMLILVLPMMSSVLSAATGIING